MPVYIRKHSPYYQLLLEGHVDAKGNSLREPTKIRIDASTSQQRKDNRQLAEYRYHARMTELAGTDGGPGPRRPIITFAAFLTWWEATVLPSRRGQEREGIILPRLRADFGPHLLSTIDRALVLDWIAVRLKTPTLIPLGRTTRTRAVSAGPATVNREVDLLKAILQAAVPKYLASSPLYGMKRLKTATPKRRVMGTDEEAKLLAVLALDDKALFLLALDGLVRLSDCLDVRRADDHGATIWIADPKAGGGFSVPVSTRLRAALDAMPDHAYEGRKLSAADVAAIREALDAGESNVGLARAYHVSETMIRKIGKSRTSSAEPSAYLFPRRRVARTERDRRGAIRSMLQRACRLAGVPYGRRLEGLTFHWGTRRTGATRMLTGGVDVGTVQKVGRWSDARVVLGIYHALIDDKARAAVETVGRACATGEQPDPTRAQNAPDATNRARTTNPD